MKEETINQKAVRYGTCDLQQIGKIDRLLKEERERTLEEVKKMVAQEEVLQKSVKPANEMEEIDERAYCASLKTVQALLDSEIEKIKNIMMPEEKKNSVKIKVTNTRTGEYHIYKESDRINTNGYTCLFKDLEDGDIIKTEIIKE